MGQQPLKGSECHRINNPEEGEGAVYSLVSKDQHWQMQNEGKLEKLTDQGNKIQRPLGGM